MWGELALSSAWAGVHFGCFGLIKRLKSNNTLLQRDRSTRLTPDTRQVRCLDLSFSAPVQAETDLRNPLDFDVYITTSRQIQHGEPLKSLSCPLPYVRSNLWSHELNGTPVQTGVYSPLTPDSEQPRKPIRSLNVVYRCVFCPLRFSTWLLWYANIKCPLSLSRHDENQHEYSQQYCWSLLRSSPVPFWQVQKTATIQLPSPTLERWLQIELRINKNVIPRQLSKMDFRPDPDHWAGIMVGNQLSTLNVREHRPQNILQASSHHDKRQTRHSRNKAYQGL